MPNEQHADFTPVKVPYNPTGSFKFWCQKVLPLVYDDSLSYYETLCKVVTYLNSVIENADNLNTSIDNVINSYNELQDYVNHYFDNLDVTEEINAKLDEMAEDGTLTTIIAPTVVPSVSTWLAEHLTPTTPPIDKTLTIENAGADSKKTGDMFSGVIEADSFDYFMSQTHGNEKTEVLGGVTFKWQGNRVQCIGTASGAQSSNGIVSPTSLMGLVIGDTYRFVNSCNDSRVGLGVFVTSNSGSTWSRVLTVYNGRDEYYTVPNNITGFLLRAEVGNGDTVNCVATMHVYNTLTNQELDKIAYGIKDSNCFDFVSANTGDLDKTETFGGVTFAWRHNIVSISGTASGQQSSKCISSPSSLLGMEKGKTYRFAIDCPDHRIALTLFSTTDHGANWTRVAYIYGEYNYTVPNNVTGFLIRVDVGNGDTVNTTAILHCYNTLSNNEIESLLTRALMSETSDLPNNTDFHDIKSNSLWLVDGSKSFTNAPPLDSKTGFLFSFNVANGAWYLHLFIPFSLSGIYRERGDDNTWSNWVNIAGGESGDTYNNYYEFNHYTSENTITCTPTITTDTNAYLAPSGSADRTADILAMLNSKGICRLGKGLYYIKNLEMPTDTTIEGCGDGTLLIMTSDADFGIKMNSYCILEKFMLVGKLAAITPQASPRAKHGIIWEGNYTQSEDSTIQPKRSIIDKVFLAHFEGGGIACYDTGYGTYNHLEITNCYIWNADVGVYVRYKSEFHKFTNVRANECYYGCVNNGGNNVFVNCDFSTNIIGFLMSNVGESSPNNSHGSAIGCVFNHSNNNQGVGIKIINCNNGYVFSGCQIFFSQIEITDSSGVVVSDSNFGSDNCDITITNGNTILFANNMHQSNPTITVTGNNKVHFVNCYNRTTGGAISN